MSLTVGYIALIVAAFANGTFGVLHKLCKCSNEVFCAYFCVGGFLVSELTLIILPALDQSIEFSPLGFPSGLSQFFAINCVFFTIKLSGVAIAITAMAAGIVLASATIENILILNIYPANNGLFVLALIIIMVGLVGVFVSRRSSDLAKEAAETTLSVPLTAVAKTDGDEEQAASAPDGTMAEMSPLRRWLLVAAGTLGVTVGFIMIKLWERLSDGVSGLRFTWSFGIGLLSSAIFVPFVFLVRYRAWPKVADLGSWHDVLAGIASGAIWAVGNAGIDLAIDQDIALGTANSVFQLSTIVAGVWGVYYKELEGGKAIALFFAAAAVFMTGIFMDAVFGGSPDDGSGDSR